MSISAVEAHTCCANCNAPLDGEFCHRCGQRHLGDRLNSNILFKSAFEAITDMDSRLWRTIAELTYDPGGVALRYINGARASYINPIRYFLTILAVYVGLLVGTGAFEEFLLNSSSATSDASVNPDQLAKFMEAFRSVLTDYLHVITVLMVPVFALLVRWQYWRANRNYAETLCFMAFVAGQSYLYGILILVVQYFLGAYDNNIRAVILVVVFLLASKTFFEMTWLKTLFGGLVSVIGYMMLSSLLTIGLTVIRMLGFI